ncbi:3-deoxy-D-manno-octulosonate 8-phosphate phosphatase [hydrothermal vent metagenome]|uniref:3-deoxy-D-manno-octulosonate 8-phosphate phosphatase n=1 Tax=hydrothermal vent metagenome TaxID=652676 RepID=A0A1W1C975_9ZZZZ
MKLDNNYYKAKQIKLLILDVDGVLTDGGIYFSLNGEELKRFNALDGHGLKLLQQTGVKVAIISARKSELLKRRMQDLGITLVYQGCDNKLIAFEEIKTKLKLENTQIAYVGDDVIDLPVMSKIGLKIAVENAHEFVKNYADIITKKSGGNGAVREVCDYLLKAQGKYEQLMNQYLK